MSRRVAHAAGLCGGAGAVERSEVALRNCYACDSAVLGETGLGGSNRASVAGRESTDVSEFACFERPEALPGRDYRVWTEAGLDAFLMSPGDFVSGTATIFVDLRDKKERANLIAYLAATRGGRE